MGFQLWVPWHALLSVKTPEIIIWCFREFWCSSYISKALTVVIRDDNFQTEQKTEGKIRKAIKHVLINRLTWGCWSKTSFKPSDHLIFPWFCGTDRPWLLITLTCILCCAIRGNFYRSQEVAEQSNWELTLNIWDCSSQWCWELDFLGVHEEFSTQHPHNPCHLQPGPFQSVRVAQQCQQTCIYMDLVTQAKA